MSEYPTQNIELCACYEKIDRLKSLCARAADMLEGIPHEPYFQLITELREAAK